MIDDRLLTIDEIMKLRRLKTSEILDDPIHPHEQIPVLVYSPSGGLVARVLLDQPGVSVVAFPGVCALRVVFGDDVLNNLVQAFHLRNNLPVTAGDVDVLEVDERFFTVFGAVPGRLPKNKEVPGAFVLVGVLICPLSLFLGGRFSKKLSVVTPPLMRHRGVPGLLEHCLNGQLERSHALGLLIAEAEVGVVDQAKDLLVALADLNFVVVSKRIGLHFGWFLALRNRAGVAS